MKEQTEFICIIEEVLKGDCVETWARVQVQTAEPPDEEDESWMDDIKPRWNSDDELMADLREFRIPPTIKEDW